MVECRFGVYSCAIDYFIKMVYHAIFPLLKNIQPHLGGFTTLLVETCVRYQIFSQQFKDNLSSSTNSLISIDVRHKLWGYIIANCPSFAQRDCNAQFSEIFQERVFSFSHKLEKFLFISRSSYSESCKTCFFVNTGRVNTFVQYITGLDNRIDWASKLFSHNVLPQNVKCNACDVRLLITNYDAFLSTVLFIEFSPDLINMVEIYQEISIKSTQYKL